MGLSQRSVIEYEKRYCRVLKYGVALEIGLLGYPCKTPWIRLTKDGELFLSAGYAWDGCSGPTIDDDTNLRACLVHDACYQLLRMGLLPAKLRKRVDQGFRRMLREDGMARARAWYYYWGVRLGGASSAAPY